MSRVRIVFLGTPDFAVSSLESLIRDDHFEIAAVISQPDRPAGRKMQLKVSPVKELALQHGLPVWTPETVNTAEFRAQVAALGAESAVVVAFGQILGQKFLDLFPHGLVNVHGSLLPKWRGAAPIQRSVMNGDRVGGVALQIVVKKLDAGPVLGVRQVEITDETDALSLYNRLKVLGAELLHLEYMDYLRGNLQPLPQDESQVTIAPKIDKAEAKLDWTRPAREVLNRVRGLTMGPSAYATFPDGSSLKVHQARVLHETGVRASAGTVLKEAGLCVACGEGVLQLLIVQPESRARVSAEEYLRGRPMPEKFL